MEAELQFEIIALEDAAESEWKMGNQGKSTTTEAQQQNTAETKYVDHSAACAVLPRDYFPGF